MNAESQCSEMYPWSIYPMYVALSCANTSDLFTHRTPYTSTFSIAATISYILQRHINS